MICPGAQTGARAGRRPAGAAARSLSGPGLRPPAPGALGSGTHTTRRNIGAARRASAHSGPDAARRTRLARLRAREQAEDPNHLVLAKVRVRIPEKLWVSGFTRAHPQLRLEILNRSEVTPERSVSDYWISGGPGGAYSREIAAYPDVTNVDCLAELGGGHLYRVTYENPPVVYLYRTLGLPMQFPTRAQAGFIYWEIAAREAEFRRILEHVRGVDPEAAILSIRRRPLRRHLPELTDAQHELLARAMAEGYFAVPRSISLTGLARKLGRSKSSVSESLALIEKKILEVAMRPPSALA